LDLKSILKSLKLNEGNISMFLGALIILVTGFYVIRYFRNLDTQNLLPEPGQTEEEIEAISEGAYTIKKGDTLWSIAESQYGDGYKWSEIAKANDLENPSQIEEGQKLVLPGTTQEAVSGAIAGATYEVVKGDSLWNVAVRAYGDGFKWVEIARENELGDPNLIHPGNILTLPR